MKYTKRILTRDKLQGSCDLLRAHH